MQHRVAWGAVITALALAGCGGGGGSVAGGGWDGTKACDTFKKADVEAATGQTAKAGELSAVNDGSNGGAKTSLCSYELADGRSVSLLTRVSEGEDIKSAVDAIRNPPADMAMGKLDDVAGVGKTALWNETARQLHVWLDGDHYGIITMANTDLSKKPDFSQAKTQAVALARKIGG